MGFAIARAAREAGAAVTLLAGPVALATPRGIVRHDVTTAQQMFELAMAQAPLNDLFIATAAVADWRPAQTAEHKVKKRADAPTPTVELTENPDILASVAALQPSDGRRAPYCVGFAAESRNLLEHAREKLQVNLWAYVFMPEHVHLLVFPVAPRTSTGDVELFLGSCE